MFRDYPRDDSSSLILLRFATGDVLPDLVDELTLLLHVVLEVALIVRFRDGDVELLRLVQVQLRLLVFELLVHQLLQLAHFDWCLRFVQDGILWRSLAQRRRLPDLQVLLFTDGCRCDW